MAKERLAILIYSMGGGGAERVVSTLLPEFIARFDVHLVLFEEIIAFDIYGVKPHILGGSNRCECGILKLLKLPILAFKYAKFLRKNEITHSFSLMNRPNYINILSRLINLVFGFHAKVIISERATPSLQYEGSGVSAIINRFLIRTLYNFAPTIIANSYGNSLDLVDNFGVSREKVITIHNPFNIKKIVDKATEESPFAGESRFVFVSVGRLDSGKNHALLISAMEAFKGENVALYIVGDGELEESLRMQIIESDLSDQVYLSGFKGNPYPYIAGADAFLFGSRYEGFPNVLVEALALGTPVISSDCKSGPREILSFGGERLDSGYEVCEYGILVATDDRESMIAAMRLVIAEPSHFQSAKLKTHAQDFGLREISDSYIKAIL